MFRLKYPATWLFHRNTCRSEFNTLLPDHAQTSQDCYKEYLEAPTCLLPDINLPSTSFSELLFRRYSCRRFRNASISLQDLSNILFAGYGMREIIMVENNEFRARTVPSGGGLYPLEFYLLVTNVEGLEPGVYHYVISPALLEQVKKIELPKSFIETLFMHQPYVAEASLVIVATAVVERNMKKYGDRGYRYILYEAGHSFQNMNLMASACNLGSLNVGGFFDLDMLKVLSIDDEEEIPIYAMAIGVPNGSPDEARRL